MGTLHHLRDRVLPRLPRLSEAPVKEKRYWTEPLYVFDGEDVWLPWNREKRSAVRCKVVCAAGNHARVANETLGIDKWVPLSALLVPPDDPRSGYEA